MRITLLDVVKLLRQEGRSVEYRKRPDGSIVIKSIDGIKFQGRMGNKRARVMAGAPMSMAQQSQRVTASKRTNFYQPKTKSHAKKTKGLTKSQKAFIRNYNAAVDRVNAKYQPKKALPKIGARQARSAMSRGESFADWKRRAVNQAKARAVDLPLGAGGVAERHQLAAYIKWKFSGENHFAPAIKVANYIDAHRVSQSYLNDLHDLAYRKDKNKMDWDTAYDKAVESNQRINEAISRIKETFNRLL